MRDPDVVVSRETEPPVFDDESKIRAEPTFALPAPGRERIYGTFDGLLPPQASTARNLANRRRVIE